MSEFTVKKDLSGGGGDAVLKDGAVIAIFFEEGAADSYMLRRTHIEKISCCKSSSTSNGWHHDPSCKNWVMVY